jgi:uncharacterized membrane protein
MSSLSFRPSLTLRGRTFKGPRGWAGKPFHPPLTDIPVVSVLAALTGFWDWWKSTEKGTQARRTVNAHAWTMVTVTVLVLVGVAVRFLAFWEEPSTTGVEVAFTAVIAVLTAVGGTLGGSLVFDYGFNVETAGDHPVWHQSEADVLPGRH